MGGPNAIFPPPHPGFTQKATEYAPLFLFTSENPATVDPVHLFTRPNWFVSFEAVPVTLLAFPSQTTTVRLEWTHYMSQDAYEQSLHASRENVEQISPELELA